MFKRLACAAVLATGCWSAQAAPSALPQWEFSYTGLFDEGAGVFDPSFRLSGSFSGSDLNSDGAIDETELTGLRFQGLDFLDCGVGGPRSCEAPLFSYQLGGGIQAGLVWSEYEACCTTVHVFSGNEYFTNRIELGQNNPRAWQVTSATVISITPVPEPSQWAMGAAGLAVLGLAGLARSRSAARQVARAARSRNRGDA